MPTLSNTETAQLIRNFIQDVWNDRKLDLIDEYIHPDFFDHHNHTKFSGQAGLREWLRITNATFDHETLIEDLISQDERAAVRLTFKVVQKGEFRGVPATGKSATTEGYRFFRVADGKIIEQWAYLDGNKLVEAFTANS